MCFSMVHTSYQISTKKPKKQETAKLGHYKKYENSMKFPAAGRK